MLTIRVDRVRSPHRCAFCHDVARDGVVVCAGCGTRLHAECWLLADCSCPTLGCAGRKRVRPSRVAGLTAPARRFVARWLATILALWSVTFAGTYLVESDLIVVPTLALTVAIPAMLVLAVLAMSEAGRPRPSFRPLPYLALSAGAALVLLEVLADFALVR